MPTHTTKLHINIDNAIQAQATQVLANMGLSVSDAIQLFLKQVAIEQSLPFAVHVPNAETLAAMTEADAIINTQCARFNNSQDLFDALEKEAFQQ